MSLELYGTHLDGLALTENEKIELIATMEVIIENIINSLFIKAENSDNNNQ